MRVVLVGQDGRVGHVGLWPINRQPGSPLSFMHYLSLPSEKLTHTHKSPLPALTWVVLLIYHQSIVDCVYVCSLLCCVIVFSFSSAAHADMVPSQ